MTTEERFERIEHVTAGLADQALRDREENRQLWRDTQAQIRDLATQTTELSARTMELTAAMISLTRQMGEVTIKLRDTGDTISRLAQDSHDRDAALNAPIEKLASAVGDLISAQRPPQR